MAELEGYITVRDAARICGRTTETMRRWIWDGKLPARKLGNQLFVREEDVAQLRVGTARPEKDIDRAASLAALQGFIAAGKRIVQNHGRIDWLGMLDRQRESHP